MRNDPGHAGLVRALPLVLILLGPGCALLLRGGPYARLREPLEAVDPSPLQGRTIVLDPGHGGLFDGARGRRGTREADVNLGVALALRDLLEAGGACVVLTREGDVDLLPPETPPEVRQDLAARAALANSVEADLFVSLHHNASGSRDRRRNATETYYKMGDDGPSLDAAIAVHRHLVRNLGIRDNRLLPGNYFVLRSLHHPALLGEASYITHPRTEGRLRDPEKQRIEAQAYYLGILDYFSRGLPRAVPAPPTDTLFRDPRPALAVRLEDPPPGAGIDPSSIEAYLDREAISSLYDPSTGLVSVRPPGPIENGRHILEVRARNLRGNATRTARIVFSVDLPPRTIRLNIRPETVPADGLTPATIEALCLDSCGHPVRDGIAARLMMEAGEVYETRARDGLALFHPIAPKAGEHRFEVQAGDIVQGGTLRAEVEASGVFVVRILDQRTSRPLEGATVQVLHLSVPEPAREPMVLPPGEAPEGRNLQTKPLPVALTDRDGYATVEDHPSRGLCTIRRQGYLPREIQLPEPGSPFHQISLSAVRGGVLRGRIVVVDPEFGGEEAGATGPSGTRAAEVNLRVAQILARYLEDAGARVHLTRSGDESVPGLARIAQAAELAAEIHLIVRHGANRRPDRNLLYAASYPGSSEGRRLAAALEQEARIASAARPTGVREEASYVIQQTPCPAAILNFSEISHPEEEGRLLALWYLRRQAYALYLGIVRYFAEAPREIPGTGRDGRPETEGGREQKGGITGEVRWAAPGKGAPREGRSGSFPERRGRGELTSRLEDLLVTLDGIEPLQPDPAGRFIYRSVDPGRHQIEVSRGGMRLLRREVDVAAGAPMGVLFEVTP